MPQVIKAPQIVTERITERINTVQGEITVNLNLTITINHDGSVQVGAKPSTSTVEEVPDSTYIVPEFDSNELLSDFGAGR
jgi:hypothetical protein